MSTVNLSATLSSHARRYATCLLLGFSLAGCVFTRPFRDSTGRIIAGSIASMETITIGGIPQRFWFRGVSVDNPLLILLHGGPGASESPLFRHYNSELEQHCVIVYWDQRAAGRSYSSKIPPGTMTIAQFVSDVGEVVEMTKRRFGKKKVVLLAHSWGTILGTIYTYEHPENVAAYAGTGQIADVPLDEKISYEFDLSIARARGNRCAIKQLTAIGPPPHSASQMLVSRKWCERFGGSFHSKLSTGWLIWEALGTDEANLVDLVKFGQGNHFSLNYLWPEESRLNLTQYRDFHVPIFFLLGRYDEQVPSVLAARYFATIRAPFKRLVWFEHSAHNPPFEEPEKFNRVVITEIIPIAKAQDGGRAPTARR